MYLVLVLRDTDAQTIAGTLITTLLRERGSVVVEQTGSIKAYTLEDLASDSRLARVLAVDPAGEENDDGE